MVDRVGVPVDLRTSGVAQLADSADRAPLGIDSLAEGKAKAIGQRQALSAAPPARRSFSVLDHHRLDDEVVARHQRPHQVPVTVRREHHL